MLGRDVTHSVDIIMGIVRKDEKALSHAEYLTNLLANIEKCHSLAKNTIKQCQRIKKRNFVTKLKQHTYKDGDLVYRLNLACKVGHRKKL